MADKITIFNGEQEFVICDKDDVLQEGVEVSPEHEIDVIRFFRGDQAKVVDRANESIILDFVVIKEWENLVKSFDAFVSCRSLTPRFGTLTWRSETESDALSRYIVDCAIRVKPIRRLGVTTMIRYTIVGGRITSEAPSVEAA